MPELPLRVRRAARLLVIDEQQRLLLMHDSDVGFPGRPSFWITPGGGIDGDETPREAAVRELFEETGLVVTEDQLAGPVWHRTLVRHTFSDHRSEQEEHFFVLTTTTFTPTAGGLTDEEQATMMGARWWTCSELAETTEDIWPIDLPDLLPGVLGRLTGSADWDAQPIELPDLEQDPRLPVS
jgi:8-oxo-dGTP pyrophosphatase MutT (NUDIX family)